MSKAVASQIAHGSANNSFPNQKARILIVDSEPIICEALAQLIARQSNFTVCGALTEGRKLTAASEQSKPDLVLLDCSLRDCDGLDLIKQFHTLSPKLPLLVLCEKCEVSHAERFIRAGASGYIMKSETPQDLFDAIQTVLDGKTHLSPRVSATLLHKLLKPAHNSGNGTHDPSDLTDRELSVFEMIGTGLRTREIATRLGRSVKTIEAHRERIKNKLNLHNGAELTARAAEWMRRNGKRA